MGCPDLCCGSPRLSAYAGGLPRGAARHLCRRRVRRLRASLTRQYLPLPAETPRLEAETSSTRPPHQASLSGFHLLGAQTPPGTHNFPFLPGGGTRLVSPGARDACHSCLCQAPRPYAATPSLALEPSPVRSPRQHAPHFPPCGFGAPPPGVVHDHLAATTLLVITSMPGAPSMQPIRTSPRTID